MKTTDIQNTLSIDLSQVVAEFTKQYNLSCEQLTKQQLAEAIRQALLSGDFQRLVTFDGRQAISYQPFQECDKLVNEVQRLCKLCAEHGIDVTAQDE